MATVRIENVTKRFEQVVALNNINLTVNSGELFFLLGPSGCGKTTLLRAIAGFYDCEEGEIYFGERAMNKVPPHQRNCGFVFQNYALWPHLNIFENIAYGLRIRRLEKNEIKNSVERVLKMVRLEDMAKRKPTQLSGGQQQRVALARALVIEPDLLLLDEPLSNLDAKLRIEMREEIRRIHAATGITTIYVTHEQKEALSLAERIAVINYGQIEQLGKPRDLYHRPENSFVASFIGETNLIKGKKVNDSRVDTSFGKLEVGYIEESAKEDLNVSIRPEAIRIGKKKAAKDNIFEAKVVRSTYLGEQEHIIVSLGEEKEVKALYTNPGERMHEAGETIKISIPPEGIRAFAK